MTRYPDEEPDVDEDDTDWMTREDQWANGHCRRCGVEGHAEKRCPTVTPVLLRSEA